MQNGSGQFHFPRQISLASNPLTEAWLEIRWLARPQTPQAGQLPIGTASESSVDPFFQLALGTIYKKIRDRYPFTEALPANEAPINMLPHNVRFRFRVGHNLWPVLQFGPGVATVNFISPYSWSAFSEEAMTLQATLMSAYDNAVLEPQGYFLRYRNAFEFNHTTHSILEFLADNLNFPVSLSPHIPGAVGDPTWPTDVNLSFRFGLSSPRGSGVVRIASGYQLDGSSQQEDTKGLPVVVCEFEVQTQASDAPPLTDGALYGQWLEDAHAVIHEWFFATIDGPLRAAYDRR